MTEGGVGLHCTVDILKVTGYSLQLRMRGTRLRFTVNSEMCARLWRQFFIAELTSNRILDWISILRRKGRGRAARKVLLR